MSSTPALCFHYYELLLVLLLQYGGRSPVYDAIRKYLADRLGEVLRQRNFPALTAQFRRDIIPIQAKNRKEDPSMKKILLPVDGSSRSLRTVEVAKQLCSPEDSEIIIVKVISAQLYINSMDEIKHNAEKARPELDAVAALLPGYKVKTQVLLGSAPGVEIVEYAKEAGIDTIIMTRSSRGPLRKLGSVATYIVKNALFLNVVVMKEEG